MQSTLGNLLGAAQAEADHSMLSRAFIETAEYQTLLHTTDFNYVVGRRGTGKSAIFQRLLNDFNANTGVILLIEAPQDYEMLEFQEILRRVSTEYRILRPITRLLWTVNIIIQATRKIISHYMFSKSRHALFLTQYLKKHPSVSVETGCAFCALLLRQVSKEGLTPEQFPRAIIERYDVSAAMDALRGTLEDTGQRIVSLSDRLDEAWLPESTPTAILGGLARAVAEFREKQFPFYQVVFIRDNMFRSLAQLDDDFTRHIEGHTLRLQWDEFSLFHLITARLRVALDLDSIENEVRVWNRFAHRDLHERQGFATCLRYTLYRPRDILVLLNEAYLTARRVNREAIIDEDVVKSATAISQHRLEDLCKEYDKVLPGLRLFVSAFRGQPASRPMGLVVDSLEKMADQNDYSESASRDLMLFKDGGEMFSALYSVGFVGLKDAISGNYTFCHDGTMRALVSVEAFRETLVHPCYWKALDISIKDEPLDVVIQINDDYGVIPSEEIVELRLKRLGRLPEDLANIPTGKAGSRDFETWVVRVIRVLFSGALSNIEMKPNPNNALNQRDVVGTNTEKTDFWRRILSDYQSRQIIVECKNYEELTPEDFRQVLDYSSGDYGRFSIVVRRGRNEALTENEKDRTRAMFYEHKRLIMIVPTALLVLCMKKLRTPKKYDYAEFTMSRQLDLISRSILSLIHASGYKLKRRK